MKQEAVVNVKGVPLSSYIESVVTDSIQSNAGKVGSHYQSGELLEQLITLIPSVLASLNTIGFKLRGESVWTKTTLGDVYKIDDRFLFRFLLTLKAPRKNAEIRKCRLLKSSAAKNCLTLLTN